MVYAKAPLGRSAAVLAHHSRHIHGVAISDHHLIAADAEIMTFRWKVIRLANGEFVRRFLLHVLPQGLPRERRDRRSKKASNSVNRLHA